MAFCCFSPPNKLFFTLKIYQNISHFLHFLSKSDVFSLITLKNLFLLIYKENLKNVPKNIFSFFRKIKIIKFAKFCKKTPFSIFLRDFVFFEKMAKKSKIKFFQ